MKTVMTGITAEGRRYALGETQRISFSMGVVEFYVSASTDFDAAFVAVEMASGDWVVPVWLEKTVEAKKGRMVEITIDMRIDPQSINRPPWIKPPSTTPTEQKRGF
jgi:hypothetical protein